MWVWTFLTNLQKTEIAEKNFTRSLVFFSVILNYICVTNKENIKGKQILIVSLFGTPLQVACLHLLVFVENIVQWSHNPD